MVDELLKDGIIVKAWREPGYSGFIRVSLGLAHENQAFLASLQRAQENAIVVVAITQCHEGGVELDVYEAGSRLRAAGVLSGGGMTREAVFGKLHALLGADLPLAEVRRLIELDVCGELA